MSNKKELLQTDELAQIKEMIETFKDAAVEIKEDEDGEIEVKTNTIEQGKSRISAFESKVQ